MGVVSGVDEVSPVRVADLILGTALETGAPLYLEPDGDQYALRVDHGGIAPIHFGARLAHATIARLAFVAELDLSSPRSVSASVAVRSSGRDRQVVVTVRPGQGLRADIVALPDPSARVLGRTGDPVKGDHVGNYKILDRLGEGGMGTVYRVEHKALDRPYALKVLRTRVVERDPDAAQQFLREARLAARIQHPNIVDVFDFGHLADGRPYLVMELLEGESLADLVDREALMPSEVISIGRQLASALAAAHDVGVYYASEVRALCMMHIEAPIPAVVSPYGALPTRLAELITRCLQKVPQNRFPDMHAVVAALDEVEKVSKRRDWTKWLGR
jgi:hypothetical protein